MANCAASASTSTAHDASWAVPGARNVTTSAGPTAYQASLTITSRRSACARPLSSSGSSPSTEPPTTSAGTHGAGVRKTIGTNTSWVGRSSAVPSWKRTRRMSA